MTSEPRATIGSASASRMAAGPVPRENASASVLLEELEPRPRGITSTLPDTTSPTCGWWRSMITPRAGSSPPQKLSGSDSTRASPEAEPSMRPRALNAGPERLIRPHPSQHCRADAFRRRSEDNINAEVARRVIGPLGRVRHDHAPAMIDDRRDVGTGIHNDLGPSVANGAQPAASLDLREHRSAC